jgi:transcriptional regulator with PAS, ATPase and Fis domain
VLVDYFLDRCARNVGNNIRGINKKSLDLLQSYLWPGNIRELQNVIERSVIMCETENFSLDETWLPEQGVASVSKGQSDLSQKLVAQVTQMNGSSRNRRSSCVDEEVCSIRLMSTGKNSCNGWPR